MTWRDELRTASFRGVEFLYQDVEDELGRKTVTHEFPGVDDPYVQDLGRRSRRFRIEAFVIGPEYHTQRDALIEVIEQPGEGTFVHPHYGEFTATIDGPVRISQSTKEGGMARFSFEIVETTSNPLPIRSLDAVAKVDSLAAESEAQLNSSFTSNFSVDGLVQSAREDAAGNLQAAASALRSINGKANAAMAAVSEVDAALASIKDESATLIATPNTIATQMQASAKRMLRSVSELNDTLLDAVTAGIEQRIPIAGPINTFFRAGLLRRMLEDALNFQKDVTEPSVSTPQGQQEQDNRAELRTLVKASLLIAAAPVAMSLEYQSSEQALDLRDTFYRGLTDVMAAANDDLYGALADLRAAINKGLRDTAAALPRLSTYTPQRTMPALLLSYELFGHVDKEADLIDRNNIEHPGFVPGQVPLSVLKDA